MKASIKQQQQKNFSKSSFVMVYSAIGRETKNFIITAVAHTVLKGDSQSQSRFIL